ncbi:MAG: hypothetical protein IT486_11675 [Gammaproteobacteria bacterium]|nr:hypothetical protein [Gammaproteobacteria bacterium]
MTRQRKIDEDLWEDGDEKLSSDHVVERFYSQREREDAEAARRSHPVARPKHRPTPGSNADE